VDHPPAGSSASDPIVHGVRTTVVAALTHGLPAVIVLISADQPEYAKRCAALGVARVIWTAELCPAAPSLPPIRAESF